ncbi:MAG: hypothetical protein ACT4O9_04530 [Blastocatellia bacterium]
MQKKLCERGYSIPFVCAEDWGWWVKVAGEPFKLGVCIYSASQMGKADEFVGTDSGLKSKQWSWSKFRFVDTTVAVEKLNSYLVAIFGSDAEINVLSVTDEFPF